MSISERQVQLRVKKLTGWADKNGVKLNPGKSSCVVFSRKRGVHTDPDNTLDGVSIPLNKEHTFLGVLFDQKLTFIPHTKKGKHKRLKTMNILKVISHQSYGADKELLRLYIALVGSRLDYGSLVYGSGTKTALRMLDPVLHLGLRLASGAFRTSPVQSLYDERNKWCLENQRTYIDLLYAVKI